MRLDPALVNIPASPQDAALHGSHRLLRDLAVVGRMQEDRPSASERLEAYLGAPFFQVLRESLGMRGPGQGIRRHRAA